MNLSYGQKELDYLKKKDKKLGAVIDKIGFIARTVDDNLFISVIHAIVAQQISAKAADSIWKKITDLLGSVSPENVCACSREQLQQCGISFRKTDYILDFATRVQTGAFNLNALYTADDKTAIKTLSALKGIGVWTAEMILLFCLQRPDIFSFNDLGIRRGLCLIYHHRQITPTLFEKYRRRFHPYGSIASLYLWAVAGGALPELTHSKQSNDS